MMDGVFSVPTLVKKLKEASRRTSIVVVVMFGKRYVKLEIKNYVLSFIGGGIVFSSLTFYISSSGENSVDAEPISPTYYAEAQPTHENLSEETHTIRPEPIVVLSESTYFDSEYSKDSNQNVETPHLVSVSSDGRMYVSSEVFADVVNSENFNQRADELVYGHNAIKTQEAYEIEAELERLLFSDSRFTDQSLEVTYFNCSNDYCVLSVDAGSEDDANSFFSYFAHPDHDYANLIMGGGAFSILNSEDGASARLAFGISEKFR